MVRPGGLLIRLAQVEGESLEDPGDGCVLLLLRDEEHLLRHLLGVAHEADGGVLQTEQGPGLGLEVDPVKAGQGNVFAAKLKDA